MKLVLILVFLFPKVIFAGNRVGNGGDVIQCPGKSTILDLYESTEALVKISEADEYLYAEKILSKLSVRAPDLEKQYTSRLKQLKNEIEFKSEIELNDVKDAKNLFKPKDKNCKQLQIAVRKFLKSTLEKRFMIDKKLWSNLDPQNKAALLTHEIIYEHFFKLGMEDSDAARKLNRLLYEERFDKMAKKEFWSFIESLKVPIYR